MFNTQATNSNAITGQDYRSILEERNRLCSETLKSYAQLLGEEQETFASSPVDPHEPPTLRIMRLRAEQAELRQADLEQRREQSRERMERLGEVEEQLTGKINTTNSLARVGAALTAGGFLALVLTPVIGVAGLVAGSLMVATGMGGLLAGMRGEKLLLVRENNRLALVEGASVDRELAHLSESQTATVNQTRVTYEEALLPAKFATGDSSARVQESESRVVIGGVVVARK